LLASVTNPAGETTQLDYENPEDAANQCADNDAREDCCRPDGTNCEGLLSEMIEPEGGLHTYEYNWRGRLVRDSGPEGFEKTVARTLSDDGNGYSVSVETATGARRTYSTAYDTEEQRIERTTTTLDGRTSTSIDERDRIVSTAVDGTETTYIRGPDPRFDMYSPVPREVVIRTPAGRTMTMETLRGVTGADGGRCRRRPPERPRSTG
jgi:hypothetical protein